MSEDNQDFAMCNNIECDKKEECRRYSDEIKASYDFKEIVKNWKCFIRKEADIVKTEN